MLGVNVLLFADRRPDAGNAPSSVSAPVVPATREPPLPNLVQSTPTPYVLDPIDELALAMLGFGPREPVQTAVATPQVPKAEMQARPRKKRQAKPVARAGPPPVPRAVPTPKMPVEDGGGDGWVIRR